MKHFVIQKNKSKCTILDFSAVVIITSSNHTGKAAVGKKFSEGIWLLIEIITFQLQNASA